MGCSRKLIDDETGFVYLRGRYYDPATERFITEDPMKDGGNWYAYCGNDPVNFIDPSGFLSQGQTLSYGNGNAADIKKLQQTLKDKGLYSGKIDGSFGPQTLAAVNAYKDDKLKGGNKGDNRGVVGATTWQSLGLKLSSSSTGSKASNSANTTTSTSSNPNVSGFKQLEHNPIIPPELSTRDNSGIFGADRTNSDGSKRRHLGMDLKGQNGVTDVYAAITGTVNTVKFNSSYGWTIVIESPNGTVVTQYKHLYEGSITIQQGKPVTAGTPIAKVGNTGSGSKGAHLHFDLIINGEYIDPRGYWAQ